MGGRTTPDLTGQYFGRLIALHRAPGSSTHAYWLCACDCGEETVVASSALRNGNTRSCGCLRRETTASRNQRHGNKPGTGTASRPTTEYNSWTAMLSRCRNPEHPRYPDWGGRGITVCARWYDFRNFLADMGPKPAGTSLGRINNDRGYEPGNCRWETPAQQGKNTRGTKLTPLVVREIKQLHASGMTMTAIGKQLKMGRHTVAKALFEG